MVKERLEPISLHQEMQRSYLEYAMSVIVGRALPDARDGLKPVQRRILYAMHELGLSPDRPYRKCARVVGDVLGKYHPHGDQAVYDALVRLVQSFASRYPVLDGHGNFGSVDDDPPAAMRYTETRLAPIAHQAMLEEIGSETVDFTGNFDGSQQEPNVLPAQLPFLLLNGCSGIAVGMATSIPPHNLNEVVDGLIALIKKPELTDEQLMKIIPGPDFPTGGEILLGSGIEETYRKGRGSIPMKGIAHIEEIQPGKGKHRRSAIIITELPYQLSKAGWIEKLADQVNEGKISGVADIRDESDRDGMRVVVELRRDTNPDKVVSELQRKTSLLNNYGAILLAIVDGKPKQLSLKQLLLTFLKYREQTVARRTKYGLKKTKERLELVQGLIKAINNLKSVIEMIQEANDTMDAKTKLIVRLEINDKQAEAVLAMPLRRLTNLEQTSLHNESKDLAIKKEALEELLNNREKLLDTIIKELKALKKKFGNPRKTRLVEGGDALLAERNSNQRPTAELQRKQAFEALPIDSKILIQDDNQVKIISPQVLGRLHLNETCKLGEEPSPARLIWPVENNPKLLAVTENGRVGLIRWEFAGQQPGLLERFLPGGLEGENIVTLLPLPTEKNISLGMLTSDGRFKRLSIEEVLDLSGRAATVLKLKERIILKSAIICKEECPIYIISNIGRIMKIMINEKSVPILGKLAQGPQTMKLLPGEKILKAITFENIDNQRNRLIIGTRHGLFKELEINKLRMCQRGYFGDMAIDLKHTKNKQDTVVDVCTTEDLIGVVTNMGRYARISSKDIEENSFLTLKENLIKLKENEYITKLINLTILNNK